MATAAGLENSTNPECSSSESVSESVASDVPRPKGGRGRPRKAPEVPLPVVTIEGSDRPALSTPDQFRLENTVLSLCIPNRLLFEWYRKATQPRDYVSLLNASVVDGVVAVREDSDGIAQKLYRRAGKLFSDIKKKPGRAREQLLGQSFSLPVCGGEMTTVKALKKQIIELESDLTSAIEELAISQDSVVHMKEQMQKLMIERDEMVHCGKKYEDMSKRHQRRKLADFRSAAEGALWFAESFGLIPESLQVRTSGYGETVNVSFGDNADGSPTSSEAPQQRKVDEATALQTLYMLDRFGVSDEFYHELTQVYPSLQRSHVVKGLRSKLNSEVDVVSVGSSGAYRSLKETLTSALRHVIPDQENAGQVRVKISGDGAKFSRSSSFVLLSFSLPGTDENVLSSSGNHTFAAIRSSESYRLLSSLSTVLDDINSLIKTPTVDGYDVDVLLGGDYKFLLLLMGMNEAHSNYSCLWCKVHSSERWDMSLPEEEYTTKKARSLSEMKKLGSHSYSSCSKHLGCVKSPLISVPLDHIVLDELHLLLRIGDVLLRNLIWYMDSLDHRSKTHMGQQTNHIRRLEEAVHSCGVSFQIWQSREPSGKPIPGSFEFTALSGKDKLKVFKKLPAKMDSLLSEDLAPQVARLWNDFSCLHSTVSSASPSKTEIDSFHEKAKQWVNDFLALGKHIEGHQRKNVTPYMHCMVFHMPTMLRTYGNLRQFSGQGVEKNNDTSKRNYFSSNRHNAAAEIIKSDYRLEVLKRGVWGHSSCDREKRKYTKQDEEYWDEGGIQEVRKRARLSSSRQNPEP